MKKLLLLTGLFVSISLFSFSDSLGLNQLEGCEDDSDMSSVDSGAPTCQGGARVCCASTNQKHS